MQPHLHAKKLRNLRTAWLDLGPADKPILYFLHGYPDSPEIWDFQIRHFENRFRIIAPYSRGTSLSEGGGEISRYGSQASVLDHLQILDEIDETQSKSIVLIGHDLGVVHAWNLAYYLGNRLKGFIVLNGLNLLQMLRRFKMPSQILRSWYIGFMNVPYLPEFLIKNLEKKVKELPYRMGNLSAELRPKEVFPLLSLNQYRAFLVDAASELRKTPRKIPCPTLVLWGKNDTFLLPPTLDELEPFAEKLCVRFLEGNHWVFRERPNEVNEMINEFLAEVHFES